MDYVGIIPQMTSNNTPSPFVASASSQLAAYVPAYAFQSGESAWITDVANSYLQIDLGKPYKVEKVYFDSNTSWTGAKINTFELRASNDLTNWVTLENRATVGYAFTSVKNYGEYRYWRIVCKSMTMRGGCIREWQLYRHAFDGDYKIKKPNSFIVEGKTEEFIAELRPDISGSVTIKANDTIIYRKTNVTEKLDIRVPYSADDLELGANLFTVTFEDHDGTVETLEYVIFKLSKSASVPHVATYQFAIKNSPNYPQNDGWIGQIYNFDYLNSESGTSYMFRYKPYAQMDARHEHRPSFAEKVNTKTARGVFGNIFTERVIDGTSGITLDLKKAELSTIRKAVHWDGYRLGFEEAGIVNRILYSWGIIDKEDIGIVSNATLAMKRDKVTQNMLGLSKIVGHRNKELMNTLSVINAYVTAQRNTGDTIVNYYEMFKEVHPYKDTVVAMGYINSVGLDKIVNYTDLTRLASKWDKETITIEYSSYFDKEIDLGVKGEYTNAQFLIPQKESISIYQSIAHKIDRHGHRYPYATLVNTTTNEGTKQNLLNASGYDRQGIKNELLNIDKYLENRIVYLSSFFLIDKDLEVKEGIMSNMLYIDDTDSDALITHLSTNVNLMPSDALVEQVMSNVLLMGADSYVYNDDIKKLSKMPHMSNDLQVDSRYVDLLPMDANNLAVGIEFLGKLEKLSWVDEDESIKMDVIPLDANSFNVFHYFNKLFKDSDDVTDNFSFFEKTAKDIRFVTDVLFTNKSDYGKEGFEVNSMTLVENIAKNIELLTYDTFTESSNYDAYDLSTTIDFVDKSTKGIMLNELDIVVDKVKSEVFKMELVNTFNVVEKISVILESWKFFVRLTNEGKAIEDAAIRFIKEERHALNVEDKEAIRQLKDTFLIEQLAVDYENVDAYITQLAGNFERVDQHDASQLLSILSDKEVALSFIKESINAHRENVEKEAIVNENVWLVDDRSDWQDIWNRYSPGVDVLDPPDDDYDYSKLTPRVYDEVTGKPLHPIGATNSANVKVGMPLSHPIPENNEVGIDETKRIAVDNYIFIDTVLALESIKGRNKLRYAGMPAGKTIREVFSQLYTWIQQAAPGHEEYERMFRFARWYAESVTIRQSKFILERTYNPWLSSLHTGGGLGIPHMKAGWLYNTVSNTYDTTSAAAHLEFTKELMIDGQFILRGYFDNPLSQGTIEISVDGVVVDTFTSHGVFKREVEVPQGHHTFRIDFVGTSSFVSISTIEITGVQFVSAITVTDDSDTNGLKALNELMSQLLGYFELHHGGRKVKGTMEIRQRAVWNTHT